MKLSIIVSIYNSHEALKRQVKYLSKLNLSDDVELIFIDDGSDPELKVFGLKNSKVFKTNNKLAWTQGLGRNLGASKASGNYLLFTDIDHILSKEAIEESLKFIGDRMVFKRYFGILDRDGELNQSMRELENYGLDMKRINRRRGLYAGVHMNTFAIKKNTFETLCGYNPKTCSIGFHPISRRGDDCYFNSKWNKYARENNIELVTGPGIYIFPNGRFHKDGDLNPQGLFHNLSQVKQERFYK